MHDTIEKLIESFRAEPDKLKELRVFAIDEDNTFRLIDSRWNKTHHMDSYGYAAINKLDRGKILSVFAKLEFLVNECISLALFLKKPNVMPHIKFFKTTEKPDIERMIQGSTPITCDQLASRIQEIAFKKRVEYCRSLNLIDSNNEQKIKDLADVRNFLAHEWDEKLAAYKSKKLSDRHILADFSRDTVSMFELYIREYMNLQEQVGYEELLNEYIDERVSGNGP